MSIIVNPKKVENRHVFSGIPSRCELELEKACYSVWLKNIDLSDILKGTGWRKCMIFVLDLKIYTRLNS